MNLTKKKLTKEKMKSACVYTDRYEWWLKNCYGLEIDEQFLKLSDHNFNWANHTICELMNGKQRAMYAIFSAKQVLALAGERKDVALQAIEAAEKFLKQPSQKNGWAVDRTAHKAHLSTHGACVNINGDPWDLGDAPLHAASEAAEAAGSYSSSYVGAASDAASYAIDGCLPVFKKDMELKIIKYGITFIRQDYENTN